MKRRNRYTKIKGVGINDADYRVKITSLVEGKSVIVWICPYYRKWVNMINRCYSEHMQCNRPSYSDCTVCEDWLTFSNFKAWMEQQDWEGKHLDKDLLAEGNRVYSPENCIFIDPVINSFISVAQGKRSNLTTGYSKDKYGKYTAQCNNPLTGDLDYLGYFFTPEEAHSVWKNHKHKLACELAESEYVKDARVAEALRKRYK